MVQLRQPVKISTKDGEATIHITLELNVNFNAGNLSISATNKVAEEDKDDDKTHWAIPEFTASDNIDFGKTV